MDRQSHRWNNACTLGPYSIISLWACDLLIITSPPYADATYRKTSLTFSDVIGAVRLQIWVDDINEYSPPPREPQINPPSRLVRMAKALSLAHLNVQNRAEQAISSTYIVSIHIRTFRTPVIASTSGR